MFKLFEAHVNLEEIMDNVKLRCTLINYRCWRAAFEISLDMVDPVHTLAPIQQDTRNIRCPFSFWKMKRLHQHTPCSPVVTSAERAGTLAFKQQHCAKHFTSCLGDQLRRDIQAVDPSQVVAHSLNMGRQAEMVPSLEAEQTPWKSV